MARFQILDEFMEVAGSPLLHDRMRVWFQQEVDEGEAFALLLRVCRDHLKRVISKRRVLIMEEGFGRSWDSLRKSMARDSDMLAGLREMFLETK